MRKAFHEELAAVESRCVDGAALVLEQLSRVMEAERNRDTGLADKVIAFDDAVDEVYIDVERRILGLLATQAPVASDLRLVSALLHMNIHLERMGDICTNIAKMVKLTAELPAADAIVDATQEMAQQAAKMIHVAVRAFSDRDATAARSLTDMDESIDRLNRRMIREIINVSSDEAQFEWGMRMVLVSRHLERLGDHAVDIGEQVAFMVTGEYREFEDASHKPGILGVDV